MRSFKDGDEIWIEPFRAKAFPVVKDLVVDRGAFDTVVQAGGYISAKTGNAPRCPRHSSRKKTTATRPLMPPSVSAAEHVWPPAKTARPMLFTAAKVAQFTLLPQGQPERKKRVLAMVEGDG